MPKFPQPPAIGELARIAPDLVTLPAGTELWRVYFRGGARAAAWHTWRTYGPVRGSRFDHHLPPPRAQERGILYAAARGPTCVAEVFQQTRLIDRTTRDPWLAGFATAADLLLLDLTGLWPTRAGASMAIGSGPRPRAQHWSRAIYAAYPRVHGLLYCSSMHGNAPAVALYERARPALPTTPFFHQPLAAPALLLPLQHAALALGYGLV